MTDFTFQSTAWLAFLTISTWLTLGVTQTHLFSNFAGPQEHKQKGCLGSEAWEVTGLPSETIKQREITTVDRYSGH